MTKELSPLEALNDLIDELECEHIGSNENEWVVERKNIIETALKDYEKKTKLAKEYKDVNNVAKRLKALEIIKKYLEVCEVHNGYLLTDGNGGETYITKEQYDLLKEVLL